MAHRNVTQDSFSKGRIDPRLYGKTKQKFFSECVKELVNYDILTSGELQKREGFRSESLMNVTEVVVIPFKGGRLEAVGLIYREVAGNGKDIYSIRFKVGATGGFSQNPGAFGLDSFQADLGTTTLYGDKTPRPKFAYQSNKKITFRGSETVQSFDVLLIKIHYENDNGDLEPYHVFKVSKIGKYDFSLLGLSRGTFRGQHQINPSEMFFRSAIFSDSQDIGFLSKGVNTTGIGDLGTIDRVYSTEDLNVITAVRGAEYGIFVFTKYITGPDGAVSTAFVVPSDPREYVDSFAIADTARFTGTGVTLVDRYLTTLWRNNAVDLSEYLPEYLLPATDVGLASERADINPGVPGESPSDKVKREVSESFPYPLGFFPFFGVYDVNILTSSQQFDTLSYSDVAGKYQMAEGLGGFILIPEVTRYPEVENDPNSGKIKEVKHILCLVMRLGKRRVMLFPFVAQEGTGTNAKYGVTRQQAFNFITSLANINHYYPLAYNSFDGQISSMVLEDNRCYYASNKQSTIWGSSVWGPHLVSFGFPEQFAISTENLEKVAQGDGTASSLALDDRPGPGDDQEDVYWFNYALSSEGRPKHNDVGQNGDRDGNINVEWLSSVRNLVVGTNKNEIVGQPAGAGISLRGSHSFRGSNSSLVARGDYALFFVGSDGKTINYLFYDDGVTGLRSMDASYLSSQFLESGVRDMIWDQTKRALWVLNQDREISLFFLQREYGIEGWSKYEINIDELLEPNYFFLLKGQVVVAMNEVKTDTTSTLHLFQLDISDEGPVLFDTHAGQVKRIVGQGELWIPTVPGERGDSVGRIKSAGYASMHTLNTTLLEFENENNSDTRDVEPVNTRVFKRENKRTVTVFDVLSTIIDNRGVLPYIAFKHTRPERSQILNFNVRLEIEEL